MSTNSSNGDSRPMALEARDFVLERQRPQQPATGIDELGFTEGWRAELRLVRDELRDSGRFGEIVGVSPVMRKVYEAIERVAPTQATVLLTGATGTGKELAAAMVHRLSLRSGGPFVALNCGAVSATLIESELFGHERGAFTGAERLRKGVFEQAEGGTLFLDEITEMAPELQVRLLRILETSLLTRVGGSSTVRFDVRIIAATNRCPHAAVAAGALRQDLLYRLDVFPLHLPPLRERGHDVELLATSFLAQINAEEGAHKRYSPTALARLGAAEWPGNVRELRNVVRRAWIMSDEVVEIGDLALGRPQRAAPSHGNIVLHPGISIQDAEKQLIEATLSHVNGNKRTASYLLGISIKTLYTRLGVYAAEP